MLRPTGAGETNMNPNRWRLDGQLALITGGSAGIGRAIARELLGLGARVLIAARDANALESARDELADEFPDGDIRGLVGDVVDEEQRRELLDWVEDRGEGLNILVNNAGGNLSKAEHRLHRGRVARDIRGQRFLGFRTVALCAPAADPARGKQHRQRRQRVRLDPCALRRAVRHEQGRAAPDDAQPGGGMGRGRRARQRRRAVVHPHPAHVRQARRSGLSATKC